MNVYFPDDLEAEAREVGVKLSPVCQKAVRREIDQLRRAGQAQGGLAEVVERLLRTKAEEDRKGFNDGYDAGATWARDRATYADLLRLKAYFGRNWGIIDATHFDTIQAFLFSRADDAEPDWSERLDSDSAFDRGFVEGAKDVYEAVRPHVFPDS